jgi:hypothetical protein
VDRRLLSVLIFLSTMVVAVPASAGTARDECNQHNDPDLRIQGCTAIIKQNPSHAIAAIAYNNRATAYHDKGDDDRALAGYFLCGYLCGYFAKPN